MTAGLLPQPWRERWLRVQGLSQPKAIAFLMTVTQKKLHLDKEKLSKVWAVLCDYFFLIKLNLVLYKRFSKLNTWSTGVYPLRPPDPKKPQSSPWACVLVCSSTSRSDACLPTACCKHTEQLEPISCLPNPAPHCWGQELVTSARWESETRSTNSHTWILKSHDKFSHEKQQQDS